MNTIIEEEDENIRRTMGDSTPNHYKWLTQSVKTD